MSVIDTLIVDRSEQDYQVWQQLVALHWADMTAAQQTEWLTGRATKGSYGASDLNRVISAITYLAQRLEEQGYSVSIVAQGSFTEGNNQYCTYAQIVTLLNNVNTLRSIITLPSSTPTTPATPNNWTLEDANNIERILQVLDDWLTRIAQTWFYCDELYTGEV